MGSSITRSLVVSALFALGSATAQTTIHVPADWPTIQEAIMAAVDGDTVLVAPGTYVEEIDFLGKAITVTSESGAAATILSNVNAAVSFVNGEGPGSVLRGFTVTGNNHSSHSPVYGPGARPRILQCVIRDNNLGSSQAAVYCDGTLIDCLIQNNFNGTGSAGVYGAVTLKRCVLRSNGGYDAVAASLFGGGMEDCVVIDNGSGKGSHGGAVFVQSPYPIQLKRCLIARNRQSTFGGLYSASGAGLQVSAFSAPVTLVNCSVVSNSVSEPGIYGPDHGGIYGPVTLVNCIVRDNAGEQFQAGVTTALYSNIEGGLAGTGNIDLDPLFRDALNGDFHVLPGSPCIDAGSPSSPLDFDESRADVGALAFTHALAAPRNGSGVNLPLLTSASVPALGTDLSLTVHAALVPQPAVSGITLKERLLAPGVLTPFGEFLVGGATLALASQPSNGVADAFSFAVPTSLAVIGFEAFAQGYVLTQGPPFGLELGNALRLLIGQ